MTDFAITLSREDLALEASADSSPEERAALGILGVWAGDRPLSAGFDDLAQCRQDGPLASGYHLAEWLLCNWWRLRYEPQPYASLPYASWPADWLSAHCMAEIGAGYVWPNVVIFSDGRQSAILSVPSAQGDISSFRYFGAHSVDIPWSTVEDGVDDFVKNVMELVDGAALRDTNLHRLWADLAAERKDPGLAKFRRIEALLGADPDRLPEEAVESRLADGEALGDEAVDELAAAASGKGVEAMLTAAHIREMASSGMEMRVADAFAFDAGVGDATAPSGLQRAADVGVEIAREVRQIAQLGHGEISNRKLAALAGVSEKALEPTAEIQPLSFTLRNNAGGDLAVLRGAYASSRRFDLARLLGDRLAANATPMRPSTQAKTYRQKVQRAFAAEFLAPIDEIVERAQGDFSDDRKEELAQDFQVSPVVIDRLLKNNRVIPRASDDFVDFA